MKLPIIVYAIYDEYSKEWNYRAGPEGMESMGWVLVEELAVEFDAPPESVLITRTIAAYRSEQQRIRADAEQKAMRIEQTICEMLCLEDRREAA